MQVVKFPSLGSVEGPEYINTAIQIFQKIKREELNDRALKRWMRGQGTFDKESFDFLKDMLDLRITEEGAVSLGGFAQGMLDAADVAKRQTLLFERIAGRNEILVKYVFDALQERLYSTSELYRMLTSYVYPGKAIDLPDFNLWLKWMESTGRVRVLGIRWATGKRFEESLGYVKSIDVDEILEEEAEEALAPPSPPSPAPAAPPAKAPEGPSASAPEPSLGWEPPEDDEEAPDEPAPLAPQPSAVARAGAVPPPQGSGAAPASATVAAPALGAPAAAGVSVDALVQALGALSVRPAAGPELIEARLLSPAPHLSALAADAPLSRVREALEAEPAHPGAWLAALEPSEEAMAENVRHLLEWWGERADRPAARADQFGIMPFGKGGWERGQRGRFLFRLSCLAVSLLRGGDDGPVAFATLDGARFFDNLFDESGGVERLLDELFEQGLGGRPELFANLHLHLMLARSLRGAEGWCEGLEALDDAALLSALWQRLAAFKLDAEVLWVAREMSMFGLWRQEGLRALRVVPTAEALRAAFHLGLVDSARAPGLPGLLAASRRLTPLMGQQLEGPLVAFWRAYGASAPRRFWSR